MSKGLATDIQMEIHPVISIIISIIQINAFLACYHKHDWYVFTNAEKHKVKVKVNHDSVTLSASAEEFTSELLLSHSKYKLKS